MSVMFTAILIMMIPEKATAAGPTLSDFSLRANLLHWATLTPDVGVEWRIAPQYGFLVNGTWTSWSWKDKKRRYGFWKISPEIHYYIGNEKRCFVGIMYHIGELNLKLNDTGRQGNYQGGGITAGYRLKLSGKMSLELHTAIGYTRFDYDKYTVTDGIRIKQDCDNKNYWGINQFGAIFIWEFGKE